MGKVYDFLSRWTKIDELLAPYSARIFEKVATRYGRTMMAVGAGVGIAMLIASIGATGVLATYGLQRLYLVTHGVEVHATVVEIATDPSSGRGRPSSQMTAMTYAFAARNGETVTSTIRREQWEFAGITQRSRPPVLYAENWPKINIPRVGLRNSSLLAFSLVLGLVFSVHMVCFLRRYRTWRRTSSASTSVKARIQLAGA